jgi:hypothetical protein
VLDPEQIVGEAGFIEIVGVPLTVTVNDFMPLQLPVVPVAV